MNSYDETIKRIHEFKRFGEQKPNLLIMGKLMEKLGNPQEKLKIIHVAGTNGKGSVCSVVAKGLENNNYKVGLFTSPYIMTFNERMKINSKEIENEKLVEIADIVFKKSKEVFLETQNEPKQFEITTAIAFLFFYMEKCDYVVLEVGLGGRFDATNIIKKPILSVITKISLDHTKILGKTREEIAFEKGGIIKEKVKTFYYNDVSNTLFKIALEKQAPLETFSEITNIRPDKNGAYFTYENDEYRINILGKHQVYNLTLGIMVLKYLNVATEIIKETLKNFIFEGRFLKICEAPLVYVDGAHNVDGAKSLIETIEFNEIENPCLIISMGKEKDYKNALKIFSKVQNVILTSFYDSVPPTELKQFITSKNVTVINEMKEIVEFISKNKNFSYIFCGSLYKIGEAISSFRQN